MLSIICNLKFCYKFFQEENFESLSDSQFARFEQSLESTEQMIELQKKAVMISCLSQANPADNRLDHLMESLDRFSHLIGQFWEQELEPNFLDQLEAAAQALAA